VSPPKEEGAIAAEILMEQEINFYHTPTTVKMAWDFAGQYHRLTLYDAFYLAIAKELESEFWTADQKLYNSISHEITWVRSVFDD
jgi:predicted nucleic acid-binding protein